MKVICINNGALANNIDKLWEAPELIEGNIYTVTGIDEVFESYYLAEIKEPTGFKGYNQKRFIPLSNIYETQSAISNIEVV